MQDYCIVFIGEWAPEPTKNGIIFHIQNKTDKGGNLAGIPSNYPNGRYSGLVIGCLTIKFYSL